MRPHKDIRPSDALPDGQGRLVNNGRVTPDDPDFRGAIKINGRLIVLKGWLIQPPPGAGSSFITLRAVEQK